MKISIGYGPYGLYGVAEVRGVCRVAGIFVRVRIGLWKVKKTSSKVVGGNFELLQDTRDAFFVVHRKLGLSAKENYSAILVGSDCCLR